ncbi:1,4-dihydroxy-2-naphthoate polyprenyltransferase [Vibrio sp. JC009]|uniref:1,4-dihydroxy-2-naphthoate polyprenyltransferase n=1 Tax=Vibrio sp. JC009 TaxID=2912314 RepID=UPI0023B0FCF3|nr:1,4-dihydroxy-2-naphthoate polyprenyltransferase [Vibrio sp. JC009]WED21652.1 1,4-dihydroxy-2-naphthoate polyprenyltransferase [Vibrio sp. JC009]
MNKLVSFWLDAARPKTLPLAFVSIICGSSLAHADGQFSAVTTFLALLTTMLLQFLSNLANDYGDAEKGTDNENRLGDIRGMQKGIISRSDMKKAIIANVILAIASGLALIFYSLDSLTNILIFIGLGLLAIVSAIAYTVGGKAYGYVGLGDVAVLLFYGLLGVGGSYYLQTGSINLSLLTPALGCGLLAVGVLNINNMRDIDNDRECGKYTVPVRLGEKNAKYYHQILLWTAFIAFSAYLLTQLSNTWLIIPFLISALLLRNHGKAILATDRPAQIAPMMPVMVKCAVITNILFSLVVVAQTMVR